MVLTQGGFETVAAADGAEGIEAVRVHQPDVVTLDVSLPDMDGFAVASRVRELSGASILMISGQSGESDAVLTPEAEVDDYLAKPFRPRELLMRVETLLRRPGPAVPGSTPVTGDELTEREGQIAVDMMTRVARVDGLDVELTRSEAVLLSVLLQSGRRVQSKTDLAVALHRGSGPTSAVADADRRAVEVHMANLRRKIGDSSVSPRWIETVRGVGYRFVGC